MFGSGRAILSLRESYRNDLRAVKQATGFDFIRFHAIFHDEVGLYDEDAAGNPVAVDADAVTWSVTAGASITPAGVLVAGPGHWFCRAG